MENIPSLCTRDQMILGLVSAVIAIVIADSGLPRTVATAQAHMIAAGT